ncbi:MAG TPA: hypothetical protein VGQ99_10245 [Tepidisphaeraceae bacterium]|nr:hypothetical protein [Tepidisphaeraceae bacterium]
MVPPAETRQLPEESKACDPRIERYCGEIVYIYAFDVAYDMKREGVKQLLGQSVQQVAIDSSKRAPRQHLFYRPQMVQLPAVERTSPLGKVRVQRSIKLLPVGAISITVRVPFEVSRLGDLVGYHDLTFAEGSLHDEVRALAEQVTLELKDYYIKPNERLADEEAYTVFCIHAPLEKGNEKHISCEQWLEEHRREVAALLTQEPDIDHLSEQEAAESTGRYLSYYDHDLVVVDWDAALILDQPRNMDETLYVMELANLQLAELEAYDRILDEAVERSYRDVGPRPLRNRASILRQLGEIRIDLARLSDELSNITKFFGDWHMARIYQALSTRFHMADWHKSIDEKLKTLDDLYQLLKQNQNNRWMLMLEVAIVVLFVIDVFWLMIK